MTTSCTHKKASKSPPAKSIKPSIAPQPQSASWSPAVHPATTTASTTNNQLLIDLQIDIEFFARIERRNVLHCALLAGTLRPKLVVGVLQKLAEAIGPIVARNVALHRERMAVLQIHRSALHPGVGLVDHLALHHALRLILSQQHRRTHSTRRHRAQAAQNNAVAEKSDERIQNAREADHTLSIPAFNAIVAAHTGRY